MPLDPNIEWIEELRLERELEWYKEELERIVSESVDLPDGKRFAVADRVLEEARKCTGRCYAEGKRNHLRGLAREALVEVQRRLRGGVPVSEGYGREFEDGGRRERLPPQGCDQGRGAESRGRLQE
jgi:hypothetical protein